MEWLDGSIFKEARKDTVCSADEITIEEQTHFMEMQSTARMRARNLMEGYPINRGR